MNTELVRAVFDCGIDDLRLLDDAECDMYAVIGRMRKDSQLASRADGRGGL